MPDVALSWYGLHCCIAHRKIVPGDSRGPKGPRNDSLSYLKAMSPKVMPFPEY